MNKTMSTFGKDFFISINGDRVVICKNAEGNPITWEELNDPKLRFLYEVGQRVLTPFGIQTIKEIDYNYGSLEKNHGYEWLILVEENGNQYKPIELVGIVVKEISLRQFKILTGEITFMTIEEDTKVGDTVVDEDGEAYIVKPKNATCHSFFHSDCVNKDIECYKCDEYHV